jgi:hypothetical protein
MRSESAVTLDAICCSPTVQNHNKVTIAEKRQTAFARTVQKLGFIPDWRFSIELWPGEKVLQQLCSQHFCHAATEENTFQERFIG